MRALILEEGYSRGALAATRGLAAAGWTVGIGSPHPLGLAASSRHARRHHSVPEAWRSKGAFVDAANEAIASGGYQVVFGAGEAEVLALSLHRERVRATVPLTNHEDVLRALDKVALSDEAKGVGLAVPELIPATTEAVAAQRGPVVVKARFHANAEVDGAPPRQDTNVVDPPQLGPRVAEMRASGADVYLQDYLSGSLVAYTVVCDRDHQVVAEVQQRALEIWPPRAGASARAITTLVDRKLAGRVQELLRKLRWFGLAEMQFVVPAGGEPHLIDLNGRFYGSLALALAAGVNLPAIWGALALGEGVPSRSTARPGSRYQWLGGDLRVALAGPRARRAASLAAAVAAAPGSSHSVWSPSDPKPTAVYLRRLLREMSDK